MLSFATALNREVETIKRPPPLPVGSYVFRVTKLPDPPEKFTAKASGVAFERLTFVCAALSALDDVAPEELAAFGDPAGTPSSHTFLFNTQDETAFEGTLNRVKSFMEQCGIDMTTGTLGEKLIEIPNAQFGATISHRLDPNDPSGVPFAQIDRTFKL